MTSNTEFQSQLSKKSSLILGGEIAFREQMGGGTVSGLFRHQISAEADVEVLAMVGLRSILTVQTSRYP
jgi:DnaJ family protein C protein 11